MVRNGTATTSNQCDDEVRIGPVKTHAFMADKYLQEMVSPAVAAAQMHYYGHVEAPRGIALPNPLTEDEQSFIASRDSFYLGTVSEAGWPYIQHRGGQPGFLHVLGPSTLAFADYRGNRQLISTGNLAASAKVSLFLMDYAQRTRLKILGHARVEDARQNPGLVAQLADPGVKRVVERIFFVEVISFDWNCPKYITPRYTAAEVEAAVAPLQKRITELEAQLDSKAASGRE